MKRPVILKFGGSSVGSSDRFKRVVQVIRRHLTDGKQVLVVASALSGVTNKLSELCNCTLQRDERLKINEWLFRRHRLHAADVLSLRSQRVYDIFLQNFMGDLEQLICSEEGIANGARNDTLLAIGERLSIHILALALEDAGIKSCAQDASDLIKTDNQFGEAVVALEATTNLIQTWYKGASAQGVPVITGFIGSTEDGRTTTLGRGGSDYSASLVAASLNALRLERWTDVDGVYTNDPRLDDKAVRYEEIVLEDAVAWNRAGKLGMHRKALDPLVKAKVPVFVRSIDQPDWPGTVIRPKCHKLAATG